MEPAEVLKVRTQLGLSRPQLARFLQVAEVSIVRWESEEGSSPRGMAATMLAALRSAIEREGAEGVRRAVLSSGLDALGAIQTVTAMARGLR